MPLERSKEKEYLRSLLRDIQIDQDNFKRTLVGNEKLLNGLDTLLSLLSDSPFAEENVRPLYLYSLKYTYYYLTVEFSDVTISQLKKSGDSQKL